MSSKYWFYSLTETTPKPDILKTRLNYTKSINIFIINELSVQLRINKCIAYL